MNQDKITVTQVEKATAQTPAYYFVFKNGIEIGMLRKYRNTRTDTHPWQALGLLDVDVDGMIRPLVGVFYPKDGGKQAAIEALVSDSRKETESESIDWSDPPLTMEFDDLVSCENFKDYQDNGLDREYFHWHILLKSGWVYSGDAGSSVGSRCDATQKLDPHTMH